MKKTYPAPQVLFKVSLRNGFYNKIWHIVTNWRIYLPDAIGHEERNKKYCTSTMTFNDCISDKLAATVEAAVMRATSDLNKRSDG